MKTDAAVLVVPVIVNASAGGGHDATLRDTLSAQFAAAGMPANIILAKDGAELVAAARTALAPGPSSPVAATAPSMPLPRSWPTPRPCLACCPWAR
jgi:hypothetical protein